MQGPFLRKYDTAATINFQLFEVDGIDFRVDAVHASGDTVIMKDEGDEASTTNGFTDEGTGYSIVLTATEMQAARIVVYVADLTATKVWLDTALVIETYGNASALHAFDLDVATQDVNAIQISGDATAADNLELDYDGTGYAKANSTVGTATDVTNEVSADVTAVSGDATAANNLELDYDGTGYNKSASTINTAANLTTNNDKTGYGLANGAITAAVIATGAIDEDALAADLSTYQVKVGFADDDGNTTDRYTVVFQKNGQPITSGITSPTIQVIKDSDGSDLVSVTALTQVASLGYYKHDETSNRIVDGSTYQAKIQATIDAATRTWYQWVGRAG